MASDFLSESLKGPCPLCHTEKRSAHPLSSCCFALELSAGRLNEKCLELLAGADIQYTRSPPLRCLPGAESQYGLVCSLTLSMLSSSLTGSSQSLPASSGHSSFRGRRQCRSRNNGPGHGRRSQSPSLARRRGPPALLRSVQAPSASAREQSHYRRPPARRQADSNELRERRCQLLCQTRQ